MASGAGPELSVVIPAFNAAGTLGEQLDALARQSADFPWEVVVADNGSTDGTPQLAREWEGRVPGLVVVDASSRRGPAAARNAGAAAASAPLLAFCDADDVVADDWVEQMRAALQQYELVGGAREFGLLNPGGRASVTHTVDTVITKPYFPRFSALSSNNLGIVRGVFTAVGGFDETLMTGEDVDLCWRVQLEGGSFRRCPEAVVHIRERDGLRAVFRQAYSYAAYDRQLKHKYARLIEAYWDDPEAIEGAEARHTEVPLPPAARRPMASRLLELWRPSARADAARRIGELLGERFARIDARGAQLSPEPRL